MKKRTVVRPLLCVILLVALLPVLAAAAHPVNADSGVLGSAAKGHVSAARPFEGTLDLSFNPGTGADDEVDALALQPDGKVVIGGRFLLYNGTSRNHIARVNANGSLDISFDVGTGTEPDTVVYAIALQTDGKILIGGDFTLYNGFPRYGIARLNSNGSLDTTFDPGAGVRGNVLAMAVQPNGKILIAGWFDQYDGTDRANVARLNANGSLDTSFDPGQGPDDRVHSLTLQADGKLLIGGYFRAVGSQVRKHVARLNANGSLDTTFNPGALEAEWAIVYAIVVQPNGKILVGGSFSQYDGVDRIGIARANANGSIDPTFDPGSGLNNEVYALALQPDGRVLVAGAFDSYDWGPRWGIARANSNGSLDTSFDPGAGAGGDSVAAMARQPDGRVLIGGSFTTYDNVARNRIARVNGVVAGGYHVYLPCVVRHH
jgi:uncharacterized delta-60 repeat protein